MNDGKPRKEHVEVYFVSSLVKHTKSSGNIFEICIYIYWKLSDHSQCCTITGTFSICGILHTKFGKLNVRDFTKKWGKLTKGKSWFWNGRLRMFTMNPNEKSILLKLKIYHSTLLTNFEKLSSRTLRKAKFHFPSLHSDSTATTTTQAGKFFDLSANIVTIDC